MRRTELAFVVVGTVRYVLGYNDLIVTPYKTSDMFLITLSTGFLYELKIVTSFFLKSAEKSESHSCTIEGRLELFRFLYVWNFVSAYAKIGIGRCPENVG